MFRASSWALASSQVFLLPLHLVMGHFIISYFFNQQSQPCVIAYYLYLNFQRTPVVSFLIVFLFIKNTANGRDVELASTPCLPAGVRSPLGQIFRLVVLG